MQISARFPCRSRMQRLHEPQAAPARLRDRLPAEVAARPRKSLRPDCAAGLPALYRASSRSARLIQAERSLGRWAASQGRGPGR